MWGTELQMETIRKVFDEVEPLEGYGAALRSISYMPRMDKIEDLEKQLSKLLKEKDEGKEFFSIVKYWKSQIKLIDAEMRGKI